MAARPKFVERKAQRYAGIRERLGRDELAEAVPRTLSELLSFLQKRDIRVTGPALVRYLVVDYNTGGVEVDIGAPVEATSLPASSRVRSRRLTGGTFATVIHRGHYGGLVTTTGKLLDWAEQNDVAWQVTETRNVTRWKARVEHYLVGPPAEKNPEKWRTEIALLVSQDRG